MTPLAPLLGSRGGRAVVTLTPERVHESAAELAAGLDTGGSCLPEVGVHQARAVIAKVDTRLAISGGHTVVALAGATGSGKSSLFNALVGADVSKVGARRPTTASPTAAVWGQEAPGELLDWLGVSRRHEVQGFAGDAESSMAALNLGGLVLLDLPDFDSREASHRAEADRVLALVDVFVWVTDPQKYADARLHEDYVRLLAAHEATTLVVLNQGDRLTPEALGACRADLQRLLVADGLPAAEVLVTSASTGSGVMDLRFALATAVQERTAAQQRLLADIRSAATELRRFVADSEPALTEAADEQLVEALSRAAGIPTILAAVEGDYRREAWARTGWPFTRWARAFRPDPLRRLRLGGRRQANLPEVSATDVRAVLGRSSLPPATPAARSAVDLATRAVGDRAAQGLPRRWAEVVADVANSHGEDQTDALDQAVMGTPLRARRPLWWACLGVLQWVLALVALVGIGWLLALMVLGWLQLPQGEPPALGALPYPLLLGGGGLVGGFLLGLVARAMARAGGRRRRRLVGKRLHDAVAVVAQAQVVAPVQAVLARHAQTRRHLDEARG